MEEGQDFSLHGKAVVTEDNLRDEYYWKLVADFIGPQSGEGLDLDQAFCRNRLMIQVGLLREDNNFPWIAIIAWLKKIFPSHQSADFRRLIERGIATTLSLAVDARLTFLDSQVNFNFVGPICDSIGVERQHLLELRDFSERAQLIEVTNGLILELSNFVSRENLSPVVIVTWLRNFNPQFCKNGDIQKAYKNLKAKIKKLKIHCSNYETRSHRRNAVIENLLQSPFELVRKKEPKLLVKKRMRRDDYEKVIKEESEDWEISQAEGSRMDVEVLGTVSQRERVDDNNQDEKDSNASSSREDSLANREPLTLLDIAMLSVQKLSSVYGGKSEVCKQVSLDLLKNHYTLTYKEHPAMEEFEKKVRAVEEQIPIVPPVVFLNYNANFLVDLLDAIEQQIISFEKDIIMSTGEKLGRDKLPNFRKFVSLPESATSRYIHMTCDILSPRSPNNPNYRKHWVAFCEEKGNPSRLAVNQSNRFINYFEAAAGVIHHHKEIALFFSDLLSITNDSCPNVVLESVTADANDSMIQSFVCVLAIVYCKIIGPYWQLLKSGGEYSLFSQYLLSLYQKFLDWSKDPSTLLEPEESTNVFMQFPLQEKTFDGVFHFCGQWHTNRNLIRVCLKSTIKVIAAVTEDHLKDFLPGGIFSQIPPKDVSLQLVSCTFSVLMAEYPYGHSYPYKKKRPDKLLESSSNRNPSEDEDEALDGLSDDSLNEFSGNKTSQKEESSPPARKGQKRVYEEEPEENMDLDYITATVKRNGGPCKTQQDVDKMLLQFEEKPRREKREAIRCEMIYQKMVLNNTDKHLDCIYLNSTQMVLKLKLALPRIKPGYSLVLAPRKTKPRPPARVAPEPAAAQSDPVVTSGAETHLKT
ncbi:uncharacterized protein LOC108251679 [Kryptolebias marmoratus]|uniref:Zgc:109744 n=1 Tax=Kryptolebias marmoratus TaxID=37003 RepID=A0A3Q3A0M1_KRYMA|nr:uncharacterized protein LOC108251679 [Kryptolebias marmoratus]XP_017297547.1 uncharacterized protein LOC108251679 [Kryptolebias marmoratus]